DDGFTGPIVVRPVDQQEGIAVWDPFQDLRYGDVGRVAHSPLLSLRPPALRISQALSFIHCRRGRAGTPPQVSPGGTSFIAPEPAASLAPAPMVMWSATPARPPNWAPSPTAVEPEMPVC